ncbi:hypothetical protein BD324DRAFT_683449 [Kockovaella imperatae]|uniref:Rhodanese domain-containing protein n=1 Tax=Kockovaella imperatae TaxID=4999 RepID=A0A1Y1UBP9_9TREE|nr:hypothetical protein BD324DRAFT_683449 [Kockovaella imperatae]ORX34505.1 hypothetical protein BD324DRAFT_683449 [Kockovaella imperatae]
MRPLSLDEYKRYGRQMIQSEWGLPGQLKLKRATVAVVGAGGLGCPVLQYLAGAGVGTIRIVDHDEVDVSNLHRQVLHTTDRVGRNKAESAAMAIEALNPHVKAVSIPKAVHNNNAIELLSGIDILIDCTDRPETRYLLSDTAVRLDIPLVSGAAIASSGQWAVYGGVMNGKRRACYRCMWPAVIGDGGGRCSDVGVWGPVTGMVGCGMAGEAIKEILGHGDGYMHMMRLGTPLRSIKLRSQRPTCSCAGGEAPEIRVGECSTKTTTAVERVSPKELHAIQDSVTIVDTRPPTEFGICALESSHNVPLADILAHPDEMTRRYPGQIVFVCRQGNDSLLAAEKVQEAGGTVKDLRGGLVAWSRDVDPEFPVY